MVAAVMDSHCVGQLKLPLRLIKVAQLCGAGPQWSHSTEDGLDGCFERMSVYLSIWQEPGFH